MCIIGFYFLLLEIKMASQLEMLMFSKHNNNIYNLKSLSLLRWRNHVDLMYIRKIFLAECFLHTRRVK